MRSFFKNPTISKFRLHVLSEQYADIPGFTLNEMNFKISAAWLINNPAGKAKGKEMLAAILYNP